MTVEAAFIVPASTFMIALIIYFTFFLYGKCILTQDLYILGFRAAAFYEQRGYANPGDYVADKKGEVTGGRYFAAEELNITSSSSGDIVKTEGQLVLGS